MNNMNNLFIEKVSAPFYGDLFRLCIFCSIWLVENVYSRFYLLNYISFLVKGFNPFSCK
ncbi:hypothetical protein M899_1059 [Bacteriovorax sp. BSW11_IV]|nr:hypothetical protein M899_1059 [Bacteriovorax sp. BSW11_IV]